MYKHISYWPLWGLRYTSNKRIQTRDVNSCAYIYMYIFQFYYWNIARQTKNHCIWLVIHALMSPINNEESNMEQCAGPTELSHVTTTVFPKMTPFSPFLQISFSFPFFFIWLGNKACIPRRSKRKSKLKKYEKTLLIIIKFQNSFVLKLKIISLH